MDFPETEEKLIFANSRGDSLTGVMHRPVAERSSGAVILCHGMDSTKESEKLVFLCRALAQRGILALRFDFAYVGESTGKFEDITYTGEVEDLRAAYSLVQGLHDGKTAILGSSMGGTVALLFAAEQPDVAALVTVAAPVHPEQFPRRVLTPRQFRDWREQGFTHYNGRRINVSLLDDLERLDVPAAAQRVACPTLVIHGAADAIVPVVEAYKLHAHLAGAKKLSILKGTDHRLSNPAMMQRAIAEALDWLAKHVS